LETETLLNEEDLLKHIEVREEKLLELFKEAI